MKISEILAISGQSGLYRYIASSRNGIIVESIIDNKRTSIPQTAKVSSFGDIAVYTIAEDMPLTEVLEKISVVYELQETVSHKSDEKTLKAAFCKAIPDYDTERVRTSDIKKIISWYNSLIKAGITDFSPEEEQETAEQE